MIDRAKAFNSWASRLEPWAANETKAVRLPATQVRLGMMIASIRNPHRPHGGGRSHRAS